jgi:hypothetical protein
MESVRKQSLDGTRACSSTICCAQTLTHDVFCLRLNAEVDIEQIKASVDEAKLDVRSAAQKFAEMDRKAGASHLPMPIPQHP